ncbi:MFS transporter [uncultured Limosilactobacillus sp.]|uniref:MFS transporter n=1 Tax=uncultured Limosilactobacillus sp. TaxID=2837629 RepID=UPI0025F66401|nr:MFS transporter [uncultured Limosilactobacillus sp.]
MQQSRSSSKALLITGIILLGACMRAPFTALPSVITEISASFHVPVTNLGILTTIPLLCFGIFSSVVPIICRRLGNEIAILLALIVLIIGAYLRVITYQTLLAGTLLCGLAITFINVLLPAIITEQLPNQVGLMTSLYGVSLDMFSALFAYIIIPLTLLWNWRIAVMLISSLAVVTFGIWLPNTKIKRGGVRPTNTHRHHKSIWQSWQAWCLLFYMAGSSMSFYITVTWLPTIARNYGMASNATGIIAGFLQLFSMPAAFIIPLWASRLAHRQSLIIGSSLLTVIGFLGLLIPTANFAYFTIITLCLGLGTAASYSLIMTLFGLKTTNANTTRDLSGMVQSLGYIIAAAGPVTTGWLKAATDNWDWSLIVSALVVIICTIFGLLSEKEALIEI